VRPALLTAPALRVPGGGASLLVGAGVMLLASGPTLLSVGLAAELHGRRAVALAAVAFTVGSMLAPALGGLLDRRRVPAGVAWPLLGAGMVAGWVFAPGSLAALAVAQLLSGASLTAFEGSMDAAAGPSAGRLAWAGAARGLGGAAGTAALPGLLAVAPIGALGLAVTAVLGAAAAATLLRRPPRPRPAAPAAPAADVVVAGTGGGVRWSARPGAAVATERAAPGPGAPRLITGGDPVAAEALAPGAGVQWSAGAPVLAARPRPRPAPVPAAPLTVVLPPVPGGLRRAGARDVPAPPGPVPPARSRGARSAGTPAPGRDGVPVDRVIRVDQPARSSSAGVGG